MALIKEISGYGISVNYWRITEILLNRKQKTGNIILELFASKEAEKSLDVMSISIDSEYYEEFFEEKSIYSDINNASYEYIKQVHYDLEMVDDQEEKSLHPHKDLSSIPTPLK